MRLFDAPWINHDGGGIFSVDIHPLGKKLATAGQDQYGAGLLVIWPIDFVFQPKEELLESEGFGFLARITQPKSVNCVRWSPPLANDESGGYRLVCGGDDPVLCIYECTRTYISAGTFGSSSTAKNLENYRCVHKLYGHSLDVMHVDWSPDGKYIASCSLDNTIIVWNVLKLPEKVAILKSNGGHDRGVKGLSWDPLGRFLSTQAEDKSLKIWRTDSWECVHTFREPFSESTGTALFSRMDWSPNGSYLICPCAMNNGGPTAKVISRKDWSCQRDLVGFRKAVTCVRANPRCFYATNSTGKRVTVSCFATGSRDRSLAVWLVPSFGRPLIVLNKIFKLSVLDMSWNNLTLAACSREGTVKLFRFTEREIGEVLSSHEMANLTESLHGFRPPIQENKDQSVSDENFVYASWLKSVRLAKANKFAPKKVSENEKYSDKHLKRMIMKVRHQRKEKGPTELIPYISKDERKKKAGWKPKVDAKLFQKRAEKKCCTDASSSEHFSFFALPEQKRLLFVNVQKWTKSNVSIATVEVLNEFNFVKSDALLQSTSQDKCTRINGYNHASKVVWTVFTPRIVSLLSSNSCWTVLSTFDGRLMCLSTQTGRTLFCAALQPISIMTLNGDSCIVVDCRGQLTCWNLLKYRSQSSQCISQLFSSESQQLVAPFLSVGEDSPSVIFTDHNSFTVSEDGWTVAGNGVGTTIKELFIKLGCLPPSTLFPSSMFAPKNVASDITHLCRMLGINNESTESSNPLAEDNCENELKTMLIKAMENGSASQTRFLGSIYAMRMAGKGKRISLQNFLDQSTNSDGDEKSKEMHAILSQIFQEYNI